MGYSRCVLASLQRTLGALALAPARRNGRKGLACAARPKYTRKDLLRQRTRTSITRPSPSELAADPSPRFGRMAEQPSRFAELMRAIREGSQDAVAELLQTYGDHLLRVIRRWLDPRLRRQFDSTDFQQDVLKSFWLMPRERMNFDSPEALGQYLARMARNKVAEAFRTTGTSLKRNALGERSLEDFEKDNPILTRAQDATPSQFAVEHECWERLNCGKSEKIRLLLTMLRERRSYEEIARATGLHHKAIQRY